MLKNRCLKMTCMVLLGMGLAACEGAHRALQYTHASAPTTPSEETTYPAGNWGSTVGKTLPNFRLTGVLSGSAPDVTGTVAMADYFDPDGRSFDLLHITFVTLWCPHCSNQSKNFAANAEWLRAQRITNVEIVVDGPQVGTAPTQKDASAWAVRHGLFFPVLLDVKAAITGKIWDIQSIPMHILVNPRNMKILDVRMGEIPNLVAYEQGFLDSAR